MSRRCGWCGRPVNGAALIYEIETDHGAAEIVWCEDAKACNEERGRQRYARPSRIPSQ